MAHDFTPDSCALTLHCARLVPDGASFAREGLQVDMTRSKWLAVAATFLTLTAPNAAHAADPPGTYVVSACRTDAGPAPLAGWYVEPGSERYALNGCASGGGFGLSTGNRDSMFTGEDYRWLWDAPPDVVVAGVRLWDITHLIYEHSGIVAGDKVVVAGSGIPPTEDLTLNTTRLAIGFGCGNPDGCFFPDGPFRPFNEFLRIDMVLRDLSAPELSAPATGSLLAAGPLAGSVGVHVAYRDRGGGLKRASLLVDGVSEAEKAIDNGACAPPFTTPVPCPLSGAVDFGFDTTSVPDGTHRVELVLQDVAGNRSIVGTYAVLVHNAPPAPAPLMPGRLTLARASIRSAFRSSGLEGALVDFADAPLPNAAIDVAYRIKVPGAPWTPGPSITTDAAGRFSLRVDAGPSRTFRFRYAASEATADVVVSAPVTLRPSARTTRNGRAVRFDGRVPGSGAASTRVELQAWANRRWVPFKTVLLRNGRFSGRYRFTHTTTTTRYRFRAVVRADPNFPYAPGVSKTVSVLVRG
jgi:hypothetical protein